MHDVELIKELARSIFLHRGLEIVEKALKCWIIATAMSRRLKVTVLTAMFNSLARFNLTLLFNAFGKIKVVVMHNRSEKNKAEFAERTKNRLKVQAVQMMKAREESLRIGRSVLDRLTSNKRHNLLEKVFGAFKRSLKMKVDGVGLVKRWLTVAVNGQLTWAFLCWKSKCDSAKAYASRAAFLGAADGETRARLCFILTSFWDKKDVGRLGNPHNTRNDKRRTFLRWKRIYTAAVKRDLAYEEVEIINSLCGKLLGYAAIDAVGGKPRRDGVSFRFEYSELVYSRVRSGIEEMCNLNYYDEHIAVRKYREPYLSSILGDVLEEKKVPDDEEEIVKGDNAIHGCLVMVEPGSFGKRLLVYLDGGVKAIPGGVGVIGDVVARGRFDLCSQLLKDARYDGTADDMVVASAGREISAVEKSASIRYQSLTMKSSSIMSRTSTIKESTTSRSKVVHDRNLVIGVMGQIPGLSTLAAVSENAFIPDLAVMGMPIIIGDPTQSGSVVGVVLAVGKIARMDDVVARTLSLMANAVGGLVATGSTKKQ